MKTNYIFASILMVFILLSFQTNAQSDRKYNKTMEKDYKKKIKELEKDDWKVTKSSLSIDAAVMQHRKKINSNEKNREIIQIVTMCADFGTCVVDALSSASNEFATEASSYIQGRILRDMFNNSASKIPVGFNKFYGAFEQKVAAEIKGAMHFSVGFQKNNGEGYSFQSWYIINEDEAYQARLRALEQAANETKLAQEYANQVSNFIQEGFKQ